VFTLVANSGDPLADLKGRNPPVPAHVIEARRHHLQLDRSLPERYWHWIRHVVRGDMGQSIRGLDVRPLLFRRVAVTLRMVLLAIVLATLLAVGSGTLSAVRQYAPSDYILTFAGFLFLSMPRSGWRHS
jgi:peptide/nickel transport system permease protein